MKKILGVVFLSFFLSTSVHSDNIKNFKIENISIGDSALDYFNQSQIENSELDWHNYSYKEYSTSLLSGKGCLLYTSPSPRDKRQSRMPSSA